MEEGAIAPVPEDNKNSVKYTTDLIVVLDLDETLYRVPRSQEELDTFLRQGLEQEEHGVNHGILGVEWKTVSSEKRVMPIKLRPGVLSFLKETALTRRYEMHIFTAGRSHGIGNKAVDALSKSVVGSADAQERGCSSSDLFAGRWFLEDCEDFGGLGFWYCKPLKKIVRASQAAVGHGSAEKDDDDDDDSLLKRVVIVDDRSDSYFLNKSNGIPVREFVGDTEDGHDDDLTFERLSELLRTLESVDDVRPVLKAMFEEKKREFL